MILSHVQHARFRHPLTPRGLQIFVECTPLYQGIEIVRGLMLGSVGPALIGRAAYLAIVGAVGLAVSSRRLGKMLLS